MNNSVADLQKQIDLLQERLTILENSNLNPNFKLLEIDYQKHLQKLFKGKSHLKNKYGVTDITTDNSHIEIKNWTCYKNCLGQLLAYNLAHPKEKLIAAFFGNETTFKERAITLMHSNKIDVWELDIINNELVIQKFNYIPQECLDFMKNNMVKTNNINDKIKLTDLERFNIDSKFIPLIGYKLVNTEILTDYHRNNKIKEILLQNFQIGKSKDFVKLKDIKEILKNNGIVEKNNITLNNIVQNMFEDVEFKERININNKSYRNIFLKLTFI